MDNAILAAISAEAWRGIAHDEGVSPLDAEKWFQDRADLHLMIVDNRDRLQARCSLWWTGIPPHLRYRLGAIGHYAAQNDSAADTLLRDACERLAENACNYAVGPMDGSTWKSYRFVTDFGREPPFFLEPSNPPEYPKHFAEAGFGAFAEYISALRPGTMKPDSQAEEADRRLERLGVSVRPLNAGRLEEELRAIYRASLIIFRDNVLYSPISEEDFLSLYRPVLHMLQPDTLLLAERDGELVGFVFGIPDYLQAQRGENVNTLIIKTLARLPDREYAGLGAVLLHRCEAIGSEQLGYHRSIHALMHVGNASITLSKRSAKPIRGYTLFGKDLSR
jgi:hypothetical protein